MIIGTVSVYKENVCKKCLKNRPANLPVLSKHGVQFILIKQAQRF